MFDPKPFMSRWSSRLWRKWSAMSEMVGTGEMAQSCKNCAAAQDLLLKRFFQQHNQQCFLLRYSLQSFWFVPFLPLVVDWCCEINEKLSSRSLRLRVPLPGLNYPTTFQSVSALLLLFSIPQLWMVQIHENKSCPNCPMTVWPTLTTSVSAWSACRVIHQPFRYRPSTLPYIQLIQSAVGPKNKGRWLCTAKFAGSLRHRYILIIMWVYY